MQMSAQDERNRNKKKVFGVSVLALLALGGILSIVGLSQAISDIHSARISRTPAAILASAGVDDGKMIPLNVAYYDQLADACVDIYDLAQDKALKARQFEWTKCGYRNNQLEQGLVGYELGNGFLPVGQNGIYLTNRAMGDLSRWFESIEGKSQYYAGKIELKYDSDGASFLYRNASFYPLDGVEFSNGDFVNSDGHNHLFTMSFAIPFQVLASGEELFAIRADDDTFVFVGDKLVLDMGGIHGATTGRLIIREDGRVMTAIDDDNYAFSGISVRKNELNVIRVYHADRDSAESEFGIRMSGMSPDVVDAELADANEVQIAYNESDPSYVKPLGRSVTVRPDTTKGYIIIATVEGVIVIMIAIITVVVARRLLRGKY